MSTGQISLMLMNPEMPTLGAAQQPSPATSPSKSGEQAGGPFAGLLEVMTPPKTPQGTALTVSAGKGTPAPKKNDGTASTAAAQDGVSGLAAAGLLNAPAASSKPSATGTGQSAGAPATADNTDGRPQDVALNADGLWMALLAQINGGRMPQTDGAAEQKTIDGADNPLTSAMEGSAEIPAADTLDKKLQGAAMNADGTQPLPLLTQAIGNTMPLAAASVADTEVTSPSNKGDVSGIVALTGTDAGVGSNPPENMLNIGQAAMANGPQGASTEPALPSGQVVGQLNPAAVNSAAYAELGTAPDNQNTNVGSSVAPVSGAPDATTLPGVTVTAQSQQAVPLFRSASMEVALAESVPQNEERPAGQTQAVSSAQNAPVADISAAAGPGDRTTVSSGTEVTAQTQQEVPLLRSASPVVAQAESAPQNGARTAGQTQAVSSAQNTPVAEIPAVATAKTVQTALQQDVQPAGSDMMPSQAAASPSASQTAANYQALEGTRPAQAAFEPATGKTGAEVGSGAVQMQLDSAAAAKPVQGVAMDAVKFAAGSSGGELGSDDDKGATDSFMNGQFHAALLHQQGNADGTSEAGNVSAPAQNDVQQSGLSEQILQQVRDRLVNHDLKAGNDQIVLKLSPENLGELKLNLSMDGQRLKVEIVAENHMVRDALLQNTGSLKESLARQNISMESFDVSTGGRGAGNSGQGQQNDWRGFAQQKQQGAWQSSGGYNLPDAAAVASQPAYQAPSQHAMVDLHF